MILPGIARMELPDQPLIAESFDSRHFDTEDRLSIFEHSIFGDCAGYLGQPRMISLSDANENACKERRLTAFNVHASHLSTSGYVIRTQEGPGSTTRNHIALNLIVDGQAEVHSKTGRIQLNEGDVYINSAANYQITFGPGIYQRILFPKSLINGLDVVGDDLVILRRSHSETAIVRSAIECGVASLKCGDEKQINLATQMAASISQALLRNANRKSQSHGYDHIRDRAIEYIRDNLNCADLSVASVASHVHVSRATLYRAFENVGGLKDFIMTERVATAKSMLRAGRLDRGFVTSVAYGVGFSSPEHFSKVFKAKTGMTPTQFVKVGLN